MSKLIFAALLLVAFYSAYRVLMRGIERQREAQVHAKSRSQVEPRDLGHLRRSESGIYVPDEDQR